MIDPKQDDEKQAIKEKRDNQKEIQIDRKKRKHYHNVGKYQEKLATVWKEIHEVQKGLVNKPNQELNQELIQELIEEEKQEFDQELYQELDEELDEERE